MSCHDEDQIAREGIVPQGCDKNGGNESIIIPTANKKKGFSTYIHQ